MPESPYKVIIIGSGPAGWTAAIYAARANNAPLVLKGPEPGGQLTTTTDVENYPGFRDGILGPSLMEEMEQQARKVGTDVKDELVESVDFSGALKSVTTDRGDTWQAPVVIVASGAAARRMDIPGESRYFGYGISTCATCDGNFFRNRHVAVVGGGDSAMEEATYLANLCAGVRVIHRREALRASRIMQERLFKNDKIEVLWNTVPVEALGTEGEVRRLTGILVEDVKTGERRRIDLDGLFFAIGHTPNTGFLEGHCALDEAGYLVLSERMETNVPGVYGAGDVADTRYRQAITAAAMGCMAAMEAERYLAGLED